MCCTQFAENTGRKNGQKSPSANHRKLCRAISSQLRHVSTIGELLEQQYLLHMSSQYGKPRPTNGWHQLVSLGHPSKFETSSFHRRLSTEVNQTLHDVWPSPELVHNIYIFGGRCSMPGAKFTLRPRLAFFYIDRVTARHSSLIQPYLC